MLVRASFLPEVTEECPCNRTKSASPQLSLSVRAEILCQLIEELRRMEAPGYEIEKCVLENNQLQLLQASLEKLNHLKVFFQEKSVDNIPSPPLPRIDLSCFKKLKILEFFGCRFDCSSHFFFLPACLECLSFDRTFPSVVKLLLLGSADELASIVDFDCTGSNGDGCFESLKYFKATNSMLALEIEDEVHLSGLRKLNLSNNLLSLVPNLQRCTQLTVLDLSSNQIQSLGSSIRCMQQLKWINLSRNWLRSIEGLESLLMLQRIDLSENRITDSAQIFRLMKLTNLEFLNVGENPVTAKLKGNLLSFGFMQSSSKEPFVYRKGDWAGEAEKKGDWMKTANSELNKSGRNADPFRGGDSSDLLEQELLGIKLEGSVEAGNVDEFFCMEDIGRSRLWSSPVNRKLSGIRYGKAVSRIPKRRASIRSIEDEGCKALEEKRKIQAFRVSNEDKLKEELDKLRKFHQENGTMWLLVYNHYRDRKSASEAVSEKRYSELFESLKRVHDHPKGRDVERIGYQDTGESSEPLKKKEMHETGEENDKGSRIEEPEYPLCSKECETESSKETFSVCCKEEESDETSWFDYILSITDHYIEEFDGMNCRFRFSVLDLDEVIEPEEQEKSFDGTAGFDRNLDVICKSSRFTGSRLYRFKTLDDKIRALHLIGKYRSKGEGELPGGASILLEKRIEQSSLDGKQNIEQDSGLLDENDEKHNVGQGVDPLEEKQHNVGQNIDPLEETQHNVGQNVDPLEEKQHNVEQNVDPLEEKQHNVEQNVDPLEEKQHNVGQNIDPLEDTQHNVGQNIDPLEDTQHNVGQNIDPLEEKQHNVRQNIDPLEDTQHNVGQNIDPLEETQHNVGQNVDPLEEKQHNVEQNVDPLEEKQHNVEQNVDPLEEKQHNVGQNIDPLEDTQHNVGQNVDPLEETQHNVRQDLDSLDEKQRNVEQGLNCELTAAYNSLSVDSRRKNDSYFSYYRNEPRRDSRYFSFLLDLKFLAFNELDSEEVSEIQLRSIAPKLADESLNLCIPGFYLAHQAKIAREKLAILLVTTRTLLLLVKSTSSFYRVFQSSQTGSLSDVIMNIPLNSLIDKFKLHFSKSIQNVIGLLVGPFRQWLRFEFSDHPPIMIVTKASLRTLKFVKRFEELVSRIKGPFRAVYNNNEFLLHVHQCLQLRKIKMHDPFIIDVYALVYQLLDPSPTFHFFPLFHSSKVKYLVRSLILTAYEILLLDEDYSKWPSLNSPSWTPPKTPQFTLVERIKYKHLSSLVLEEPNAPDNFLCLRFSFEGAQFSGVCSPAKGLFSKLESPSSDPVMSVRLLIANEVERSYIIQVISSRWRSIFAVPIPIESCTS
ncbi:uncharacterized protein LOC126304973 isoform X2 [Schistocerca gregaria]|uniref:uncharacterized protein LOC126304973 isoform X2 n=1 Tax=Schistocerca gregaria TaxID=7010 RepID=UPI00211F451C|nr:uncharacterized protein LOC126304973 isoform X2 [Schistocerca gregaria]